MDTGRRGESDLSKKAFSVTSLKEAFQRLTRAEALRRLTGALNERAEELLGEPRSSFRVRRFAGPLCHAVPFESPQVEWGAPGADGRSL